MTFTSAKTRRLLWVGSGVALIGGLLWLWWVCEWNLQINFLVGHGDAEWVIYPKPPDGGANGDFEISTVFRREFTLDGAPQTATLSVRAFKRCEVIINGQRVTNAIAASPNWKDAQVLDVAAMLHAGTNEISITVSNRKAPPALW